MKAGSKSFFRISKPLLFLGCSLPFVWALAGAFAWGGVQLGANPVEALLDHFGIWSLRFLLITLAVSPLQWWTGWRWLLAFRRMLGLFAFFYVTLHFLTYALLDQRLALGTIVEDVIKRPFITLGMLALLALIPLAITSTRGWMRRLGKRWKNLHKLIYPIAILAVWHYYWQVKLDALDATVYALILLGLLAVRVVRWRRKLRRGQQRKTGGKPGQEPVEATAGAMPGK